MYRIIPLISLHGRNTSLGDKSRSILLHFVESVLQDLVLP